MQIEQGSKNIKSDNIQENKLYYQGTSIWVPDGNSHSFVQFLS